MRPRANFILLASFSILLVVPTLAGWLGIEPMGKLDEKRPLAKKPEHLLGSPKGKVTSASLTAAAQEWDKYYADNFGLRKTLVGSYRFISVHALGTSLHPAVVLGKIHGGSRWYFFNGSAVNDGIGFESQLGKIPYSAAELALTAENVRRTAELLKQNGIKFLLMIVPDKQTVYPELLPDRFRPAPNVQSRLAQFWSATEASDEAGFIDLRGVLSRSKGEGPLYLATDTHWTTEGAFVAYRAAIAALQLQDHGPAALKRSDTKWTFAGGAKGTGPGDCAMLMGLPMFGGESHWDITFPPKASLGRPRGRKLLVLGDSFFTVLHALSDYFEFEFDKVVHLNGARSARSIHITQELLDTYKPDVVMLEAVERYWTQ